MTAKQRKLIQELTIELLNLRQKVGKAELWKTYHAMHETLRVLGWEHAEIAAKKSKKSDGWGSIGL